MWRKTLEVFDEQKREYRQLSLFPADRPIPADALNAISVDLTRLKLRRPRRFGDCWLALDLWRELGLEEFWQDKLGNDRGAVAWSKVLAVLAVNRPCEPGSELMSQDRLGRVDRTPAKAASPPPHSIIRRCQGFPELNHLTPRPPLRRAAGPPGRSRPGRPGPAGKGWWVRESQRIA